MAHRLDFGEITGQMLQVAKSEMGKGWKKSKGVFKEFTESNKERFEILAELYLTGEITEDQLNLRLKAERDMLEAQLNALKAVAASTVQRTVNSVFDILSKAISAAVPL